MGGILSSSFSHVLLNFASFPVDPFSLVFPRPVYLVTVTMNSELALPSICNTKAGFKLLFVSILVDFAFALFKDDSSFS